jgi:hypothetical protein
MDVQQKIQSIQNAIDTINQKFSDIALRRAAIVLRNSIEKRVHEKSKKADGGTFGEYSKNKLPVYYFEKMGTRKVNFTKEEKKTGVSYSDFRKKLGKQNKNKNFELTGDMWRDFGLKELKANEFTLASTTAASQNILDINSEREKINIIKSNPEEEKQTTKEIETWLFEIIKKAIE